MITWWKKQKIKEEEKGLNLKWVEFRGYCPRRRCRRWFKKCTSLQRRRRHRRGLTHLGYLRMGIMGSWITVHLLRVCSHQVFWVLLFYLLIFLVKFGIFSNFKSFQYHLTFHGICNHCRCWLKKKKRRKRLVVLDSRVLNVILLGCPIYRMLCVCVCVLKGIDGR